MLVLVVDYLRLLPFFCPRLLLFGIDRFTIIRGINLKGLAEIFHFVYLTSLNLLSNFNFQTNSKQEMMIKISIKNILLSEN